MSTVQVSEKKSEIISVSVPLEMKLFLDKHPKINKSKLFQDALDAYRYPAPKKMSPSLFLLCFMGIVVGIVISMSAGLVWYINHLFAIGLMMLGLALSLGSFLTIYRARRQSKIIKRKENAIN